MKKAGNYIKISKICENAIAKSKLNGKRESMMRKNKTGRMLIE